jgi:N-acetylmuramoyl-L-alanine amidase
MKIIEKLMKKNLTNKKLKAVKGIVVHWFADEMAEAEDVIKFWEGRANGVGTQYVIGLDGKIFHTAPDDMMCYQVGKRGGYTAAAEKRLSAYPNDCVIGIECAHLDMTGKMTPETYKSLVWLAAKLIKDNKLKTEDLWLHSEIVGKDYKDCHRWFTTTKPSDWIKFNKEVEEINHPKPKPVVKKAAPKKKKIVEEYTSVVDYLVAHKQPYDFVSRVKLARKLGIPHYNGSADQNNWMLRLLEKED